MIRRAADRMLVAAVSALVIALGGGAGVAWAAFSAVTHNKASAFSVVADTAAPTVARATIMPAGGSSPGAVRQGQGYHVYVEASDDVSGVAEVTVDAGAFDAGQVAAALSKAGGPWTVDGKTYAYRSALLTADSPLGAGSSVPYVVRATDHAANTGQETFSAVVQTYADVVTSTAGLAAYWRLGEAPVADDPFTAPAGSALQTRAGAIGAVWTKLAGAADAVVTSGRRIRTSDGTSRYWASGAPPSADYTVEADIHAASLSSGDVAGVLGRVDTASPGGAWYAAAYDVDVGRWVLSRQVGGATTTLGSSASRAPTTGTTRRLSLDLRGTTVRMLVDGVELVSVSDAAITAPGRAGIWLGGAAGGSSGLLDGILSLLGGLLGGSSPDPDGATLQIDNFRVAPALGDSAGGHHGAYLRGPGLGVAGALSGDASAAAAFDGVDDFAQVADTASLDLADGPFTLEAWVKRGNTSTSRQTLMNKGPGAYHWALENHRLTLLSEGSGVIAQSTVTITDTTAFHHVAATRDATGVTRLYLDGVDVTSPVTARTLSDTGAGLSIGGSPGGSSPFGGVLDELAIYRAALTPAQIRDHHRAGAGAP